MISIGPTYYIQSWFCLLIQNCTRFFNAHWSQTIVLMKYENVLTVTSNNVLLDLTLSIIQSIIYFGYNYRCNITPNKTVCGHI